MNQACARGQNNLSIIKIELIKSVGLHWTKKLGREKAQKSQPSLRESHSSGGTSDLSLLYSQPCLNFWAEYRTEPYRLTFTILQYLNKDSKAQKDFNLKSYCCSIVTLSPPPWGGVQKEQHRSQMQESFLGKVSIKVKCKLGIFQYRFIINNKCAGGGWVNN